MKLNGLEKHADDRMEGYESRVAVLEDLVKQQLESMKSKNNRSSLNSKTSETLIKSLSDKIEGLETENYTLKLE